MDIYIFICLYCSSLLSLTMYCGIAAEVTGQQGMLTSPWHLIPPLDFRDPCCPMLTEFVNMFWTFLTILTSVSLIFVLMKVPCLVHWYFDRSNLNCPWYWHSSDLRNILLYISMFLKCSQYDQNNGRNSDFRTPICCKIIPSITFIKTIFFYSYNCISKTGFERYKPPA